MSSEIDHAPELHPGAHSAELTPWVTYLQQLLTRRGAYHGAIDGRFDGDVTTAVRQVQAGMQEYNASHQLPAVHVDGIVRHEVWQELYSGANTKEQLDAFAGVNASRYQVEPDEDTGDDGRRVAWNEVARDGQKLAPAREIGRAGWVHGSLQCTILDFKKDPYHGPVYVVFQAVDTSQSDEGGQAANGLCTLSNIWLPKEGHLRITLESHEGPLHGVIHDQYNLKDGDVNLAVHVQQLWDEVQVTVSEAQQRGWMDGTTVHEGYNFKVTVGPVEAGADWSSESHHEHSGSESHESSRQVTVHLATPNLEITRTG